ncbi:MAG: ABC transporter ATP-binding protein [Clostridia bacterium]|nr:ABC transporter ATP-binding protein [Clostridia bacterium]
MEIALHIENLYVNYGQTPALSGVCLDVLDKEFLGIIGPNGGGKTTLLKAILGLVPVSSGKILVYGEEAHTRGIRIGYVPQYSFVDRRFPISVTEAVLTAMLKDVLRPGFRYSRQQKELAREYLRQVGLEQLAERQISQLSGGEFQRMFIARALAVKPRVILLDEPTASVDPHFKEDFYELLEKLNQDMTIIMVSHDLLAISAKVKRIACINRGIVYHGKAELSENVIKKMYNCPVDLIAHGVPHRVLGEHDQEGGCRH